MEVMNFSGIASFDSHEVSKLAKRLATAYRIQDLLWLLNDQPSGGMGDPLPYLFRGVTIAALHTPQEG
jgi:hypothetical protein